MSSGPPRPDLHPLSIDHKGPVDDELMTELTANECAERYYLR
jgi:hypothetical protein